jgi:hypothetical protein
MHPQRFANLNHSVDGKDRRNAPAVRCVYTTPATKNQLVARLNVVLNTTKRLRCAFSIEA